jgi:hypothetical protein
VKLDSVNVTGASKTDSIHIDFAFEEDRYTLYLFEAESIFLTLTQIGGLLAIFKSGACLWVCNKSHHEGKLTKRFIKRLKRQKREEEM